MKTKAALMMALPVWLSASSFATAQQQVSTTAVSVIRSNPARPPANVDPRLRALRAQAAELEADRAATLARLDRSMAAMQDAVRALRAAEQRVARSAAPRSRLRPLQTKVAQRQASVESARGRLAQITLRQSSLRLELQRQSAARGSRDPLLQQAFANQNPPLEVVRGLSGYYVRSQPLAGSPFVVDSVVTLLARAEAEEMQANDDQRTAEARIELAAEARDRTRQLVAQGQAPQAELTTAEAEFLKARSSLDTARLRRQQHQDERERIARLAALQRPIDVELREATIRQAAQSIAQASEIPIRVERAVPDDKRLTVVARGIPLATVLDSIARQSGLLIAPYNNGVSLKPMPSLEVNGQRTNFMLPFAPWSSEWGMNPTGVSGYSIVGALGSGGASGFTGRFVGLDAGGVSHGFAGPRVRADADPGTLSAADTASVVPLKPQPKPGEKGAVAAEAAPNLTTALQNAGTAAASPKNPPVALYPAPGSQPSKVAPRADDATPTAPLIGSLFARGYQQEPPSHWVRGPIGSYWPAIGWGSGPMSVTALSENSFVVANPAPGSEPGVLLTVYRLEGTQLRVVSSTVHRLGTAASGRGAALPPDDHARPGQPATASGAAATPKPLPPTAALRAR